MTRLRAPDYVAGLAGLALLICLLLVKANVVVTVLLALAGLMAVALPVVTAVRDDPALPVKWDVLTAWATLAGVIAAAVRLIGDFEGAGIGALLAVLVAFAAACRAMREQAAPGLRTPPETRAMPTPPS